MSTEETKTIDGKKKKTPAADDDAAPEKRTRSGLNPLRWVRWKVVIVLAIVFGGFYLLGLDPLSRWKLNDVGAEGAQGARWNVGALDLGILTGDFDFGKVLVETARKQGRRTEKNRAFSADSISIDFNANQALRKRLWGSVELAAPQLVVRRSRDGSLNVEEIGEEPPTKDDEISESKEPTDWVGAVGRWLEKLKKWEERRRKWMGGKDEPSDEQPGKKKIEIDTKRRITYPFEGITRFVAEKIEGSGLEIRFVDEADSGSGEIPPLTDGRLVIQNVSEKPSVHPEPISWEVSGNLGGGTVTLGGALDLRRGEGDAPPRNDLVVTLTGTQMPLSLANAFAGESLPMVFEKGTVDLVVTMTLTDFEQIDVRPSMQFINVEVSPRPGVKKIANTDAAVFCKHFNEAAKQLDKLVIDDLRITGTYLQPKIELGDTLVTLATSGARALVDKQVEKGIEKGKKELDRFLEKNAPDLKGSEETRKVIEGVEKTLEKGLEGFLKRSR